MAGKKIVNSTDGSFEESVDAEMDILIVEQKRLKKELRRIDSTLSDNKRVKRFISEIGLIVKAPDGQEFPVTEDNIVGLEDIIQLLITKRKITEKKLHDINSKIESLKFSGKTKQEYIDALERMEQAYYNFDGCMSSMNKFKEDVNLLAGLVNEHFEERVETNLASRGSETSLSKNKIEDSDFIE